MIQLEHPDYPGYFYFDGYYDEEDFFKWWGDEIRIEVYGEVYTFYSNEVIVKFLK